MQEVADRLAALLGVEGWITRADIQAYDGALAPGYGRVGPKTRDAIRLMAEQEGLFLDPVYSGKCFAGLVDLVQNGSIASGARVLFVHTGGFPALFAYQDDVLNL